MRFDSNKAGGLPTQVLLTRGMRVMLTANLDLPNGLSNGSMGTVVGIIFFDLTDEMPVVLVAFDGYQGESCLDDIPGIYPVGPIERTWKSGGQSYNREMLPLIPGFGFSIHKSQGQTLDKVVINIADKDFCPGLTYTALTRARGLKYMAFSPMPTLSRITAVLRSQGFAAQLKDGHRKAAMEAKLLQDNPDIHQFYALKVNQFQEAQMVQAAAEVEVMHISQEPQPAVPNTTNINELTDLLDMTELLEEHNIADIGRTPQQPPTTPASLDDIGIAGMEVQEAVPFQQVAPIYQPYIYNSGNHCFGIVGVLCLGNLSAAFRQFLATHPDHQVATHLLTLMHLPNYERFNNILDFINVIMGPRDRDRQEDATEFLTNLLVRLPQQSILSFHLSCLHRCNAGHSWEETDLVTIPAAAGERIEPFIKLMSTLTTISRCGLCRDFVQVTDVPVILDPPDYFLIQVHGDAALELSPANLNTPDNSITVQLTAVIVHRQFVDAGHYWYIQRNSADQWVVLDTQQPTTYPTIQDALKYEQIGVVKPVICIYKRLQAAVGGEAPTY